MRQHICALCRSGRANLRLEPCGCQAHPACVSWPISTCPSCGLACRVVQVWRPPLPQGFTDEAVEALSRAGRWTEEEETYANCVLLEFVAGRLAIPTGTRLGTLLMKLLRCNNVRMARKMLENRTLLYKPGPSCGSKSGGGDGGSKSGGGSSSNSGNRSGSSKSGARSSGGSSSKSISPTSAAEPTAASAAAAASPPPLTLDLAKSSRRLRELEEIFVLSVSGVRANPSVLLAHTLEQTWLDYFCSYAEEIGQPFTESAPAAPAAVAVGAVATPAAAAPAAAAAGLQTAATAPAAAATAAAATAAAEPDRQAPALGNPTALPAARATSLHGPLGGLKRTREDGTGGGGGGGGDRGDGGGGGGGGHPVAVPDFGWPDPPRRVSITPGKEAMTGHAPSVYDHLAHAAAIAYAAGTAAPACYSAAAPAYDALNGHASAPASAPAPAYAGYANAGSPTVVGNSPPKRGGYGGYGSKPFVICPQAAPSPAVSPPLWQPQSSSYDHVAPAMAAAEAYGAGGGWAAYCAMAAAAYDASWVHASAAPSTAAAAHAGYGGPAVVDSSPPTQGDNGGKGSHPMVSWPPPPPLLLARPLPPAAHLVSAEAVVNVARGVARDAAAAAAASGRCPGGFNHAELSGVFDDTLYDQMCALMYNYRALSLLQPGFRDDAALPLLTQVMAALTPGSVMWLLDARRRFEIVAVSPSLLQAFDFCASTAGKRPLGEIPCMQGMFHVNDAMEFLSYRGQRLLEFQEHVRQAQEQRTAIPPFDKSVQKWLQRKFCVRFRLHPELRGGYSTHDCDADFDGVKLARYFVTDTFMVVLDRIMVPAQAYRSNTPQPESTWPAPVVAQPSQVPPAAPGLPCHLQPASAAGHQQGAAAAMAAAATTGPAALSSGAAGASQQEFVWQAGASKSKTWDGSGYDGLVEALAAEEAAAAAATAVAADVSWVGPDLHGDLDGESGSSTLASSCGLTRSSGVRPNLPLVLAPPGVGAAADMTTAPRSRPWNAQQLPAASAVAEPLEHTGWQTQLVPAAAASAATASSAAAAAAAAAGAERLVQPAFPPQAWRDASFVPTGFPVPTRPATVPAMYAWQEHDGGSDSLMQTPSFAHHPLHGPLARRSPPPPLPVLAPYSPPPWRGAEAAIASMDDFTLWSSVSELLSDEAPSGSSDGKGGGFGNGGRGVGGGNIVPCAAEVVASDSGHAGAAGSRPVGVMSAGLREAD